MVRIMLLNLFIGVIAGCSLGHSAAAATLRIVHDGKPMATVVCADGASAQLKSSIGILRDHITESSGARLDVATTAPKTGNVIYVGTGPWVDTFKVKQQKLDDDGFEILFPDARSMLILGSSDWGTEFGIYEFLERYVGVRWLIPGREGTHIPQRGTIEAPMVDIREEPAFFDRRLGRLGAFHRRVAADNQEPLIASIG